MHMIVQSVRLRDTILFTASRCVSKVGPPKLIKKNHLPFALEHVTYDQT